MPVSPNTRVQRFHSDCCEPAPDFEVVVVDGGVEVELVVWVEGEPEVDCWRVTNGWAVLVVELAANVVMPCVSRS